MVSRGAATGRHIPLPWWQALVLAAAGGFGLDLASPDVNVWWITPFAIVAICLSVWEQRWSLALLCGAVAGVSFWLPHLSWLTLYLGPVPWLALGIFMSLWYALMGIAIALISRVLSSWPHRGHSVQARVPRWLLVALTSCCVAGIWVLRESLEGTVPYGGFPWGRIAVLQANSPMLESVSWLGFTGLSALVVALSVLPLVAWRVWREPSATAAPRARWRALGVSLAVSLAIVTVLSVIPSPVLESSGTIRVAAVQGNSQSAIFDDRESGEVLTDHLQATRELLNSPAAKQPLDVIVWPENSAEFNISESQFGDASLRSLAREADAPIVIGTILPSGDAYSNSSLVWNSNGDAGVRYDKRHPVPFAEYMPNRAFYRSLAPELVDLVQLEYVQGSRSPVVPVETSTGTVRAGLAICFDIIFDDQARAIIDDGAQVIFAQTNNADFGRTDESVQQLAIARLRAVETGRATVNDSTVGTSRVILPDGTINAGITPFTRGAMVADVPLVSGETPAMRFGSAIAACWLFMGAGAVVAAGIFGWRNRRGRGEAARPPAIPAV